MHGTRSWGGCNLKVWSLWLQGRAKAPDFVQKNLALWERLNPSDEVRVLDQSDADRIFADLGVRQDHLSPQVRSDMIRLWLLAEEGGVWVDSTLLPARPLRDWLPELMEPAGFFAFRSAGDPNLVLQNWFLAAQVGHPLVRAWLEDYADYFRSERRWPSWKRALFHRRPLQLLSHRRALARRDTLWFVDPAGGRGCMFYPYAVHNYCLAWVLKNSADLRAIWDHVPNRSASLPLMFARHAGDRETPADAFFASVEEHLELSPVHKLNHRDPRFARVADMVAGKAGLSPDPRT